VPPRRAVLFVDDSELSRAVAEKRLAALGVGVTALASRGEATAVDARAYAAALLDLELQDGDGTELAEMLRRSAPGLPIAFLTGGAGRAMLDVAERLGPVFSKQGGVDDAIAWVARVLAG
jgi:CheY-like chemotaxis protein